MIITNKNAVRSRSTLQFYDNFAFWNFHGVHGLASLLEISIVAEIHACAMPTREEDRVLLAQINLTKKDHY